MNREPRRTSRERRLCPRTRVFNAYKMTRVDEIDLLLSPNLLSRVSETRPRPRHVRAPPRDARDDVITS